MTEGARSRETIKDSAGRVAHLGSGRADGREIVSGVAAPAAASGHEIEERVWEEK